MPAFVSKTTCSGAALLLLLGCRDGTLPTQTSEPLTASPELAALQGSWSTRAPLPQGRYFHQAGVLGSASGGPRLYVFTGHDPQDAFEHTLRSVAIYDVIANRWTTVPVPPNVFVYSRINGLGLIGGRFYLPGGSNQTGSGFARTKVLLMYNPQTNTWTRMADMPEAGSDGVAGVIGGKLYVLLGLRDFDPECSDCGPPVPVRRFFRYDPATNTWTTLPRAPNYHVNGAAGVIDGKLYVAGGRGPNGLTSTLDIYHPATNTWTTGAPMPSPSSGVAGAVIGQGFYVFGGESGQVRVYNARRNTWAMRTPMPNPRGLLAAAKVVTDRGTTIRVLGGLTETGTEHDVFVP